MSEFSFLYAEDGGPAAGAAADKDASMSSAEEDTARGAGGGMTTPRVKKEPGPSGAGPNRQPRAPRAPQTAASALDMQPELATVSPHLNLQVKVGLAVSFGFFC